MRARSATVALRCALTSSVTASRSCISTWTSWTACSTAGSSPAVQGWCGFVGADYLGDPSRRACGRRAHAGRAPDGQSARRPDSSAHTPAHVRALLQPGQLLLLLHPAGAARCGRGGGDQHAMGGAARLRARRERRGTRCLPPSFAKALHVSPFMGMEQRYTWRVAAPGATLAVHIESHERDGACLTRRSRCAARR